MNTIRVYLAESGRVADLKKDFPLYQGQFQNKLLNIYVPTSILSPEIKTIIPGQETGEYAAGTAVKIGMTHLTRNGEIKKSKNYYMRYLKTLTYQNVEYAMFERKLPQEFTLYAGYGSNAPVLIINVVNVETDVDPDEVLSIITSQTCSFDVLESSRLDNDEPVEPSELETINARLNSIDKVLPTKQDKTDEGLNTENKTVVGAINELKEDVNINTANITQNTENIAQNTNDIDYLKQHLSLPEEYIGQMTGTTLPTNKQLNDFVMEKVGREPKNADVVIFILQIPNATDKNYKYIYSADGWNSYEIPSMEQASNGTFGIVEGTYNIGSKNNTIVDISGGQILNIYVKDDVGTYRNVREYINTIKEDMNGIANGRIGVGLALKAVADNLGNDIVNTYLTQTAGATKDFVRKYSLPREFNDIFYISKDGYSKEAPTDVAPQFSVETNNIGDFTLFDVVKTNDCEYELSRKNSADNAVYISASRDCIVTFRLSTQARNAGQDWVDLDVELSNPVSMLAGQLQRVDFSSIFTYLGEKVLDLKVGDMLRQTLEVVMQEITPTTFNVYSNETYPSIFNINTLSQVVYHTLGKLGEQPVFKLTPSGAITASGVSLIGSPAAQLYNNVECEIAINIPITTQGYELFNENMSILGIELGGQNVRLATPYNFESGVATFKNLRQVFHSQDAVNGITYTMKCFIKISAGGDVTFFVDEDNLNDYVDYDYPAVAFAESERQKSKNLFNINKLSFGYTSGSWSINYDTGTITFVKSNANSTSALRLKDFTDLKAGKTYRLSYAYTGTPSNSFIYLNGSESSWGNGDTHTITQAELDSGIHMYGSPTGTVTLSDIIMVEDGVDIDYQPYNGAILHKIDVEPELIYDLDTKNTIGGTAYTSGIKFGASTNINVAGSSKINVYTRVYNTFNKTEVTLGKTGWTGNSFMIFDGTSAIKNVGMLIHHDSTNITPAECFNFSDSTNLNNNDNAYVYRIERVK